MKTYKLTFEAAPAQHALFRKEETNNRWSISSRTLRDFVEHFGPKTEQLDIYSDDGKASFTSYTEKIMSGNGEPQVPTSGKHIKSDRSKRSLSSLCIRLLL